MLLALDRKSRCVAARRRCAQVAAYCNGRDSVTEYDTLLLQHVLWQRPEHADRIADWLLGQLSVDDGLKQVGVLWGAGEEGRGGGCWGS